MRINEGGRNLVESEHMGSPTTFSLTVINTSTVFAVNYTTTITNTQKNELIFYSFWWGHRRWQYRARIIGTGCWSSFLCWMAGHMTLCLLGCGADKHPNCPLLCALLVLGRYMQLKLRRHLSLQQRQVSLRGLKLCLSKGSHMHEYQLRSENGAAVLENDTQLVAWCFSRWHTEIHAEVQGS